MLACYRANLEYNICQDDRILAHFGTKIALLEETLKSHRLALELNAENTDIQFNTGHVLTSLAETEESFAKPLLEEAVDLFTKCLAKQQNEYEQIRSDLLKAQEEQGDMFQGEAAAAHTAPSTAQDDEMETSSTTSSGPGEWATVEEPLTPESILETCTAQLGALTFLIGCYDTMQLPALENRIQWGLQTANSTIPTLISLVQDSPYPGQEEKPVGPILSIVSSEPSEEAELTSKYEALIAAANFQGAVAEYAYRTGQTASSQYAATITALFSTFKLDEKSPDAQDAASHLVATHADALLDLASAIANSPTYDASSPDLETQWGALSQAQTLLTQLLKTPGSAGLTAHRLALVFLARGDADLFRFRLSLFGTAKPAWVNSKNVLVGNAGVFYRGARTYAEKAGKEELRTMADAKAIVAEVLKEVATTGGSVVAAKDTWKGKGEAVKQALEEMVEEGILGREDGEGVLKIVAA